MTETILTQARTRIEYIPPHKFIGIWDESVQGYFPFWENHNCDEVTGVVESMRYTAHPVLGCHTAGWNWKKDKRGYFYGLGVPADYTGPVPEGFEIREFPGSYYIVFFHPVFDFLKHCETVMNRVEDLAWSFQPEDLGFQWNEGQCQDYQIHLSETIGYEVLRPIKKI